MLFLFRARFFFFSPRRLGPTTCQVLDSYGERQRHCHTLSGRNVPSGPPPCGLRNFQEIWLVACASRGCFFSYKHARSSPPPSVRTHPAEKPLSHFHLNAALPAHQSWPEASPLHPSKSETLTGDDPQTLMKGTIGCGPGATDGASDAGLLQGSPLVRSPGFRVQCGLFFCEALASFQTSARFQLRVVISLWADLSSVGSMTPPLLPRSEEKHGKSCRGGGKAPPRSVRSGLRGPIGPSSWGCSSLLRQVLLSVAAHPS